MITPIPYESLHVSRLPWLESHFHFSFSEYYNPSNTHFGVLRVMNDDVIAPHSGFETHPHRDMEIFTYVLDGALTHEDSMGNKETLHAGDIQYLSAGTGIRHSEKNESDKALRLIQTWILPQTKGVTPQYGSYPYKKEQRHNQWEHLFGPEHSGARIAFHQDANVYAITQDNQVTSAFSLAKGRQAYLKVMEGSIVLNGITLNDGDSAEVIEEPTLSILATKASQVLLIEMAKIPS